MVHPPARGNAGRRPPSCRQLAAHRFPRAAAGIQALRRERRGNRQALERQVRLRARPPPRTRRAPGLQARGYLRRGIRILHALSLFHLRGRGRGRGRRPPQNRHSRQRPQPHRAGNRIRLLLLPCRARAEGRRLRNGDGELQSRNRLDRLRHLRPPLFRAAHAGRRARSPRSRKAAGRDRAVRRADSAESGARTQAQRRENHRHRSRIDRPRRRPPPLRRAARRSRTFSSRARPPRSPRRKPSPPLRKSACRFWCARATFSAAAPW